MNKILVKDLMLPLEEYAVVSEDATIEGALKELDKAQLKLPPGRQPHRAVLVRDASGRIIGKMGHLSFLRALEPKYSVVGDVEKLSRAGVSAEIMDMMKQNFQFWQDDFKLVCSRARTLKIRDVLKHAEHGENEFNIDQTIDENKTITEAIHRLIMWQVLSILVTQGEAGRKKVVGILRLSDLFDSIAAKIKTSDCAD